jgi:hypothetical protein
VEWLTRDADFSEAEAAALLRRVEGRGYNPAQSERILEWQAQQEFPILPNPRKLLQWQSLRETFSLSGGSFPIRTQHNDKPALPRSDVYGVCFRTVASHERTPRPLPSL